MRSRQVLFALGLAYFACYVPYSAITKAFAGYQYDEGS